MKSLGCVGRIPQHPFVLLSGISMALLVHFQMFVDWKSREVCIVNAYTVDAAMLELMMNLESFSSTFYGGYILRAQLFCRPDSFFCYFGFFPVHVRESVGDDDRYDAASVCQRLLGSWKCVQRDDVSTVLLICPLCVEQVDRPFDALPALSGGYFCPKV